MFLCNIVYQFLDKDSLSDSRATEETDLWLDFLPLPKSMSVSIEV